MMKNKPFFACCSVVALLVFSSVAYAKDEVIDKVAFQQWVGEVRVMAHNAGISQKTIDVALSDVKPVEKAISLDKGQPFKTKTFDEYIQMAVPDFRVQMAKKKYMENKKLLEQVGAKYNVQPRFIVALWGIESDFGRNQGKFDVIDALATLSFEGRRREFFTKELMSALTILDKGHIEKANLKGSWAGAMGQTQFMPSSYLELAADFDKDGKRDIWSTKADVFASIANYLSRRGWDNKTTWGRKVSLPDDFDKNLIGKEVEKDLEQWAALGVKSSNGGPLPNREGLKASVIKPEDDKKETYLVYSNYKTILKWNRSLYFATAVGILSDGIDVN